MSSTTGSGVTKPGKVFSCVHCQQRKIKCDKKEPCSACVKAKMPCISRSPAPPKRRKRASPDVSKMPEMVQNMSNFSVQDAKSVPEPTTPLRDGINAGSSPVRSREPSPSHLEAGAMIQHGSGPSGYIGNKLWASITEQFDTPAEMFKGFRFDDKFEVHTDNSSELIFGLSSKKSPIELHPNPVHIFRLWQIFLDNINPVTKILHAPTFQKTVMEACSDMTSISQPVQSILFAIYALSIISISDADCQNTFGESRRTLLNRYHSAAREMFVSNMLLKHSNFMYAQAFVLYLLSIQSTEDIRSLWILTGIAVRLGTRAGLHRDGAPLGLSPFDVEMRRRLWWQIVVLDIRIAELSGTSLSVVQQAWDTRLPLNVNDSDLTPEMTKPPVEYATRATEMVYCLVRYETYAWLRQPVTNPDLAKKYTKNVMILRNPVEQPRIKDEVMKELSNILEEKHVQYCDPIILLQAYTIMFARITIARGRLLAHNQSLRDTPLKLPQDIHDSLFYECMDVLSSYNSFRSTEKFKNFLMFDHMQYLWLCIVFLFIELKTRFIGDHVERAWQLLDELYKDLPELITDGSRVINVCIGNLALKSWNIREMKVGALFQNQTPPNFITMLRIERESFAYKSYGRMTFKRPKGDEVEVPVDGKKSQTTVNPSYEWPSGNMGLLMDIDFDDWTNWDGIIEDLDMVGHGLRFSI